MLTKEITLNGKTYKVAFTVKTMMNYEKITRTSFFGVKFEELSERISLIAASILTVDDNPDISFDEMMSIDNLDGFKELSSAFSVVSDLMAIFYNLPEVEEEEYKPNHAENEKN